MTQTTGRLYTWRQIADILGYSVDDLSALLVDLAGTERHLDAEGRPTEATLALIQDQARAARLTDDPHADDPAYDSDFWEDN